MADLVCYCFGYTAQDVLKDLDQNGRSVIMDKIMEERRRGGCDCAVKNPQGR
ncbi:MAG: hypothetical protein R6X07_11970 [Desulfatiglandales bacterium]|jgi:hypothetical protein